ncbi:hypothetical protein O2W18_02570 [Modestobacter sp. VKM Ac-2983]|uniref:DUF7282 domain-containing protein n=1 Tax=Modestobacter sp. VKM Ac-2983 TaxID=3004137 RepID=UPI0022ABB3B1|nr:hypothetical protein [Modestobacter sp. VKM Ac-2983]MCZ2803982.1 hypothetical protein [Modestobacter sp. VKM Ac-2983]
MTSPAITSEVAEVEFEDQSGAGDVVTVARVVTPADGVVAVTVDDGDDEDAPLLGYIAVPAGEAIDVSVVLSPPLAQDTELEASLHGDTDQDGLLDRSVDQRAPDSDGDDVVSEDAEYIVQ